MIAGTHGVALTLKLGADITGYTKIEFVIVAPTCPVTRTVVTAFASNVTKGWVTYTTEANVFNLAKTYQIQAIVTFDTTRLLRSIAVDLEVEPAL